MKEKKVWVYERWNKIVTSDQYPNIGTTLADLHKQIIDEKVARDAKIEAAKETVRQAQEERKAMLAAANAKKKQPGGKGKKGKEEAPKEEEEVKQEVSKPAEEEYRELDLTHPKDFGLALQRRAPRPFTFGPLEFSDLDKTDAEVPFDGEKTRGAVIQRLDESMGEPLICIHGYSVKIKGRSFKKRSTMQKLGRFLKNLVITPVMPDPIFEEDPVEEAAEGEEAAE